MHQPEALNETKTQANSHPGPFQPPEPVLLEGSPAACCSPAEQTSCCEPTAKAACCGPSSSTGCGCR